MIVVEEKRNSVRVNMKQKGMALTEMDDVETIPAVRWLV